MKLRACVAVLATVIALPALAQETYVLDPVHSQPGFVVRHLGLATQRGSFDKLSGKVTLERTAKTGAVDVVIDTASIRSFSTHLDGVLKGEKYFNVEKFPTMTFKSRRVLFDGDNVVGVDGELTMLGVTKPVSLKVAHFVCGDHPFNKRPMCGAEATATIKRSEWGMTAGLPYAPADEVGIVIPIEAYRQ